MTRKAAPKKAKQTAKPKPVKVYIAVREFEDVNKSYTEPDRVFTSKKAAQQYADKLNHEIRRLMNPFEGEREAGWMVTGGDKAFNAALKKLGIASPKKPKDQFYAWEEWWDRVYHDLTEAQRDGIWDVLDKYEWYEVKTTTLEG